MEWKSHLKTHHAPPKKGKQAYHSLSSREGECGIYMKVRKGEKTRLVNESTCRREAAQRGRESERW